MLWQATFHVRSLTFFLITIECSLQPSSRTKHISLTSCLSGIVIVQLVMRRGVHICMPSSALDWISTGNPLVNAIGLKFGMVLTTRLRWSERRLTLYSQCTVQILFNFPYVNTSKKVPVDFTKKKDYLLLPAHNFKN